jgi:hypothetical protein
MKKLAAILVLALAGWFGYQYSQTGQLPFGSSTPSTPEDQELAALFDQFKTAHNQFQSAVRQAGLTGLDTTAEADAALQTVNRVEKALERLKGKISSQEGRQKADALALEIRNFKAKLR